MPTARAATALDIASVLLDGNDLYVSGGATGNVHLAPASGGAAEVWATITPTARAVPPDNFMQAVVANVANFDRARADNFAPDGTTSSAGIGASIAQFQLTP